VSAPPALIRPSELARFWELNPRTLHIWIREGRLLAIRSPGNHFRLRAADVLAFCEREGLPVPPFVSPPPRRVILASAPPPLRRAVARALETGVAIEAHADPYAAIVAAAAEPTAILALSARPPHFDVLAAVRAFKRTPATTALVVVAFDVPSRPQVVALEQAGAARAIAAAQTGDLLPGVLEALLGPGD
jgi:excisionase family DNA binding protein